MRRSLEFNDTASTWDADTEMPTPTRASDADYYLTDGQALYRYLGIVDDSAAVVGLEDCCSLEIMLVAVEQLQRAQLRVVTPAATD